MLSFPDFPTGAEIETPNRTLRDTPFPRSGDMSTSQSPNGPTTPQRGGSRGISRFSNETPSPTQVISHIQQAFTSPSSRGSTPRNRNTPDRFIPSAASVQSFRMSSPADRLSSSERLLRHHSTQAGRGRSISPDRPTTAINTTVTRPNTPGTRTLQANRRISAGAIGVFGGGAIGPPPPTTTTPTGRGREVNGHIFADKESPEVEMERHELRLSAALGVDRAKKVLSFNRSPAKSFVANSAGTRRLEDPTEKLWEAVFPTPQHNPNKSSGPKKTAKRQVPTTPFRVLDAPGLRDDYYCSLLAYSPATHSLAVGLHSDVYSWNEAGGARPFGTWSQSHVTSLAFSSAEGQHNILAIGRIDGSLTLWKPDEDVPRISRTHESGIACIAWKPIVTPRAFHLRHPALQSTWFTEDLLVGDESGNVYVYAVQWIIPATIEPEISNPRDASRDASITLIRRISMHTQQICGLAWSPDGEQFATGGNDNLCHVFDTFDVVGDVASRDRDGTGRTGIDLTIRDNNDRPLENAARYCWPHQAAVKALAFCPWQKSLLATGGGSNDRKIHFFHTYSSMELAAINVSAQVTSLLWSNSRREIAATFGYANPEHPIRIAVFSWPECRQVVQVPWQEDMRALYAVAYPGGPAVSEGSRTVDVESEREDPDELDEILMAAGPHRSSRNQAGAPVTGAGTALYPQQTAKNRRKPKESTEGCIVVAASDETVRFHEVWSDTRRGVLSWKGVLGGSDILEELEGIENDGTDIIR